MILKQGTHLYNLLELLGLSGVVSQKAAQILCGESLRNLLMHLRRGVPIYLYDENQKIEKKVFWGNRKLLNGKGQAEFIKLAPRAVELLNHIEPELQSKFMAMTYDMKYSNQKHKRRCSIISEAYAMMMRAGIQVLKKPRLSPVPIKVPVLLKGQSYFYDALEFKNMGNNRSAGYARMVGILYCPAGIFVVYGLNKRLVEWVIKDESKMCGYVDRISQINCDLSYHVDDGEIGIVRNALIFGKSTMIMEDMLQDDKMARRFLGNGSFYRNRYFLPYGEEGVEILKLLAEPGYNDKIVRYFLRRMKNAKSVANLSICHVYAEGRYHFMALTNNIDDIKSIKALAQKYEQNQYVIYLMRWQSSALRAFFAPLKNVRLQMTSDLSIYRRIRKGG